MKNNNLIKFRELIDLLPGHFSFGGIAVGTGANEIRWQNFSRIGLADRFNLLSFDRFSLGLIGLIHLIARFDRQICRADGASLRIFREQGVMATVFRQGDSDPQSGLLIRVAHLHALRFADPLAVFEPS